jgi:hypothetical protein
LLDYGYAPKPTLVALRMPAMTVLGVLPVLGLYFPIIPQLSTTEITVGANNYSPLLELSESRQSVFFKNQDEFSNSR